MPALKRFFLEALHFMRKPESSAELIMWQEPILEAAVTSVLDRDADRTTSVVEAVEDQLRELRVAEKEERRIYHHPKRLTILLGMVLAAAFLLASFGVDPKVGMGGAIKIALCILGQGVNALLPVVLCCLEGKPRAQKIVSCLSFLPAILERSGDIPCFFVHRQSPSLAGFHHLRHPRNLAHTFPADPLSLSAPAINNNDIFQPEAEDYQSLPYAALQICTKYHSVGLRTPYLMGSAYSRSLANCD